DDFVLFNRNKPGLISGILEKRLQRWFQVLHICNSPLASWKVIQRAEPPPDGRTMLWPSPGFMRFPGTSKFSAPAQTTKSGWAAAGGSLYRSRTEFKASPAPWTTLIRLFPFKYHDPSRVAPACNNN